MRDSKKYQWLIDKEKEIRKVRGWRKIVKAPPRGEVAGKTGLQLQRKENS